MENYYHGFSLLQLALLFVLVSLVAGLVYLIRIKYRPGLRHLPGPFLASITDLDRLWTCSRGHQMNYHLSLHEKHGSLVRIGPNHVSFSDAGLIPTVYNISSKFWKVSKTVLSPKDTQKSEQARLLSACSARVNRHFTNRMFF